MTEKLERMLQSVMIEAHELRRGELDGYTGMVAELQWVENNLGNVFVVGMGKSGVLGRMLAANLRTIGVRASYVNPATCLHGELGMLRTGDVIFVISGSGQTVEVVKMLEAVKLRVRKVGILGSEVSLLGPLLDMKVVVELKGDDYLLPLVWTTMAKVVLDGMVMDLAHVLGFTTEDYERVHPA